jgi:hypothetical protein
MALSTIPTRALTEQGINFRNLIINGDMSIAQRGTSFSSVTSTQYTLDRWRWTPGSGTGTFTLSQDTDVPTGQGFAKSFKADCTATATPTGTNSIGLKTRFEGQMLQYLKKGTSNAESLTLSFWVKSNKTGTYIAELEDNDNSRTINKAYTINSANTWEKKTITYAGDTSGTLNNDNGLSFTIVYYINAGPGLQSGTLQTSWANLTAANRAVGQVNLADSTSNEWYITGVQLEVGTSASDFEFLPYDVNLRRCQRYFYNWVSQNIYSNITMGRMIGVKRARGVFQHPEIMRSNPSISANGNFRVVANAEATGDGGDVSLARSSNIHSFLDFNMPSGSSSTEGQIAEMGANNDADAEILFDAEL